MKVEDTLHADHEDEDWRKLVSETRLLNEDILLQLADHGYPSR